MRVGTCTEDLSTRDVMNSSTVGRGASKYEPAGGVVGGVGGRSSALDGVSQRMTSDALVAK